MLSVRDWFKNPSSEKAVYQSVRDDDIEAEDVEPYSTLHPEDKKRRLPLSPRLRCFVFSPIAVLVLFFIYAKIPVW